MTLADYFMYGFLFGLLAMGLLWNLIDMTWS